MKNQDQNPPPYKYQPRWGLICKFIYHNDAHIANLLDKTSAKFFENQNRILIKFRDGYLTKDRYDLIILNLDRIEEMISRLMKKPIEIIINLDCFIW